MLGIKVNKENAEKAKRYLKDHNLLDNSYKIYGTTSFIYFPIRGSLTRKGEGLLNGIGGKRVEMNFNSEKRQESYREILQKYVGRDYENMTKSYDVLGSIAVVEAEPGMARKMAKAIMLVNKNVKTVVRKGGAISGIYRTRNYYHVLGERKYIAEYKENGSIFRFDIRTSFFSTRLAFERNRIARSAKSKERVLVMFAGVGPFAIEIGKIQKKSKVIAIEINKAAYKHMVENIKANRAENVTPVLGDVKKFSKKYKNSIDRIVMPLPRESYNFLEAVLEVARRNAIVHYYAFGSLEKGFEENIGRLKDFFKSHNRRIGILYKRVVRPYSPREVEVVIDFKIF